MSLSQDKIARILHQERTAELDRHLLAHHARTARRELRQRARLQRRIAALDRRRARLDALRRRLGGTGADPTTPCSA